MMTTGATHGYRWSWFWLSVSIATAVVLVYLSTRVAGDVVTEQFATAKDARSHNAFGRGIVPPFGALGSSLKTAHDLDTGEIWFRCRVAPDDRNALLRQVRQTGWSEARDGAKSPPMFFGAWHPVLGEQLLYTPEADSVYFRAGEWRGVLASDGTCWAYSPGT